MDLKYKDVYSKYNLFLAGNDKCYLINQSDLPDGFNRKEYIIFGIMFRQWNTNRKEITNLPIGIKIKRNGA